MTTGQVPETIMTGNTADISHITEFAWFDLVIFQDKVPGYPNNKMTLGCYLGSATDTGSALTSKILKANGQFVCRMTVRHLDDDELQSSAHQKERQDFDKSIVTHLGPAATADDFEAKDLTPNPAYFDDTHIIDPDYEDAKITPKWVTIISPPRLCCQELVPWSEAVSPQANVTRIATLLGSPIPTLSLTHALTSSILTMVTRPSSPLT